MAVWPYWRCYHVSGAAAGVRWCGEAVACGGSWLHGGHVRWSSFPFCSSQVIGGGGDFGNAVCCLSFSHTDGGRHLAAVDDSNDHVLSVWEWEKGENGHKITGRREVYFSFLYGSTPTFSFPLFSNLLFSNSLSFLDAPQHLYKSSCLSVSPSLRRSVPLSLRCSVKVS